MTAQSPSGNAPPPLSASSSPGNGNGSPRPASESTPAQERRPRLEGSTHSPKRRRATAKEKGGLGRSVKREEEEEEEEEGTEAELTRDDQKGFGREESTAVRPEWASAEVSAPVGQPQLTSWTSDAQLGFTDTLHRFCQLYRHEMWGFWYTLPHPQSSTARLALRPDCFLWAAQSIPRWWSTQRCRTSSTQITGRPKEVLFPLPPITSSAWVQRPLTAQFRARTLSYACVRTGYLLLGDVTHGREFFWKAREHLSYVFDSSHYDVACLLKHMVRLPRLLYFKERKTTFEAHSLASRSRGRQCSSVELGRKDTRGRHTTCLYARTCAKYWAYVTHTMPTNSMLGL